MRINNRELSGKGTSKHATADIGVTLERYTSGDRKLPFLQRSSSTAVQCGVIAGSSTLIDIHPTI